MLQAGIGHSWSKARPGVQSLALVVVKGCSNGWTKGFGTRCKGMFSPSSHHISRSLLGCNRQCASRSTNFSTHANLPCASHSWSIPGLFVRASPSPAGSFAVRSAKSSVAGGAFTSFDGRVYHSYGSHLCIKLSARGDVTRTSRSMAQQAGCLSSEASRGEVDVIAAAAKPTTTEAGHTTKKKQRLLQALSYEVEHGFSNSQGEKARFSEFLVGELEGWGAFSQKDLAFVADLRSYDSLSASKRMVLLDKLAVQLGWSSVSAISHHFHAFAEAAGWTHEAPAAEYEAAEARPKHPEPGRAASGSGGVSHQQVAEPLLSHGTRDSQGRNEGFFQGDGDTHFQESAAPGRGHHLQAASWQFRHHHPAIQFSSSEPVALRTPAPGVVWGSAAVRMAREKDVTGDGGGGGGEVAKKRQERDAYAGMGLGTDLEEWGAMGDGATSTSSSGNGNTSSSTSTSTSTSVSTSSSHSSVSSSSSLYGSGGSGAGAGAGGGVGKGRGKRVKLVDSRSGAGLEGGDEGGVDDVKGAADVAEGRGVSSGSEVAVAPNSNVGRSETRQRVGMSTAAPRESSMGKDEEGQEKASSFTGPADVAASGTGCLDPAWLLDTPINRVQCLSRGEKSKLMEVGLASVRSLLQLYPRTYVDYGSLAEPVEENQHVMCVGTVTSSCAFSRGLSLGVVETVVKYVPLGGGAHSESESESEHAQAAAVSGYCSALELDEGEEEEEEAEEEGIEEEAAAQPIFIHVYRFLRGARFAQSPFLHKLAAQYPQGAQVAISGKLKAHSSLRRHYIMRDYDIKLLTGDDYSQAPTSSSSSSSPPPSYSSLSSSSDDEDDEPGQLRLASAEQQQQQQVVQEGRGLANYKEEKKLAPVYPARGSLKPKSVASLIEKIVCSLPEEAIDPLPEDIRHALEMMPLRDAFVGVHLPVSREQAEEARRRLVFDEFFYHQLGILLHRQQAVHGILSQHTGIDAQQHHHGIISDDGPQSLIPPSEWSKPAQQLLASLPYKLTGAQERAVSEVIHDLKRPVPMHRLLQGDVGCGKTIVALLALVEVAALGQQGVLMAPTEFLAQQHFARLGTLLEALGEEERPTIAVLTGSTPTKQAKAIRESLKSGEIQLAVGTHSLISKGIEYACLGLAVIDEQHRFGVEQRAQLQLKGRGASAVPTAQGASASGGMPGPAPENDDDRGGEATAEQSGTAQSAASSPSGGSQSVVPPLVPHLLAMSATPIPRSLALALHGDMSLSQIDEVPPGRTPITTRALQSTTAGRRKAYQLLRKEVEAGGRAFIVFPVIEESENLPDVRSAVEEYEELRGGYLAGLSCGLVHGRLPANEKEEAMRQFKAGESQVLVSTTVVEVGIDIPEATVMLVEHAERYGMAQLHQLRGRVGRGSRPSICILLGSNSTALKRLKVLEQSQDGFFLAQMDLQLRGPGDLLGRRQSGFLPDFFLARLETDGELMEEARKMAKEVLAEHPMLETLPSLRRELSMRRPPLGLG